MNNDMTLIEVINDAVCAYLSEVVRENHDNVKM